MKLLLSISALVVGIMIVFIALMRLVELNTVTVQYDCRMLIGGWHPDFPAKVIEDCRNKKVNEKGK
jgi:hypothetical protein